MVAKSKTNVLLFTMVIATTIIFSCSKSNNNNSAPAPTTRLDLYVIDETNTNGDPAVNPKGQLFKTDNDRANKTNPVTPLTTGDATGNINFDNLSAIGYYYNVYSNDMSASNAGLGNNTNILKAGQLNKASTGVK